MPRLRVLVLGVVLVCIAPAAAAVASDWPRTASDRSFTQPWFDHWFTRSEPFARFEVADTDRWRDVAAKAAQVVA